MNKYKKGDNVVILTRQLNPTGKVKAIIKSTSKLKKYVIEFDGSGTLDIFNENELELYNITEKSKFVVKYHNSEIVAIFKLRRHAVSFSSMLSGNVIIEQIESNSF